MSLTRKRSTLGTRKKKWYKDFKVGHWCGGKFVGAKKFEVTKDYRVYTMCKGCGGTFETKDLENCEVKSGRDRGIGKVDGKGGGGEILR